MAKTPLLTNGIVLSGTPQKTSDGSITSFDTGIVTDNQGNLIFRDSYVTDFLQKDSISLKELYNRAKGIFYKDGNLYFKDDTLPREYSLSEIVNTCSNWKRSLASGSLWWVGRTETDHRSNANIPKTPDFNENIFWSLDKFLEQVESFNLCGVPNPTSFFQKTIDTNGNLKWWDVQGLEIVVPAIADKYKLAVIMAKLAYSQRNGTDPVIFRLYDATAQVELTRTAVIQNNSQYNNIPVSLNYFGPLTVPQVAKNRMAVNPNSIVCDTDQDCGCTTVDCVEGDQTCFIPNPNYINNQYATNSHLIKIQFRVAGCSTNYWDRYFGTDIDQQGADKSSINVMIFDASPATQYTRKHGTITFDKVTQMNVVFDNPLTDVNYSVNLSPNKNINVWYSNKTVTGFTINCGLKLQGYVDWTITKLN